MDEPPLPAKQPPPKRLFAGAFKPAILLMGFQAHPSYARPICIRC